MKHLYFISILFVLLFAGCEKKSTIVQVQEPDYKEYVVILNQSGNDSLQVNVVKNTLGGNPIVIRLIYATWTFTLKNAFPPDKTIITISPTELGLRVEAQAQFNNSDTIVLMSFFDNTFEEGYIQNLSMTVRVYN